MRVSFFWAGMQGSRRSGGIQSQNRQLGRPRSQPLHVNDQLMVRDKEAVRSLRICCALCSAMLFNVVVKGAQMRSSGQTSRSERDQQRQSRLASRPTQELLNDVG